MDDPGFVRVGEAGAQLVDVLQLGRQRKIAAPPNLVEQRLAKDVLHGDVRLALVLTDVVDGDDVDVGEAGGRLRLPREALAEVVGVESRLQHLDRDEAIEHRVAAEVQIPHAALTQALDDFVAMDDFGGVGQVRNYRSIPDP